MISTKSIGIANLFCEKMDWIILQIAIGNYLDAENVTDEVDAILCLKHECCDENITDLNIFALPIVDGAGNDIRLVEEAVQYNIVILFLTDGEFLFIVMQADLVRFVLSRDI